MYPQIDCRRICIHEGIVRENDRVRGFDKRLALFMSALCYQTNVLFKNPNKFVIPSFPEQFELVTILHGAVDTGSEVFGYIIQSPTKIIVAFRGTETKEDWIKDFDIKLVPFKLLPEAGMVHRGFYSVYTGMVRGIGSLRDVVYNTIQQLSSSKQLYITGSSLGGALGTLNALDLATYSKFHQPIIYTIGAPQVGNETFVRTFNKVIKRGFRIVNRHDVIPHLPPDILGYRSTKGKFQLDVQRNDWIKNHYNATAYFPGLADLSPVVAVDLCERNPRGFCPDPVIGSAYEEMPRELGSFIYTLNRSHNLLNQCI